MRAPRAAAGLAASLLLACLSSTAGQGTGNPLAKLAAVSSSNGTSPPPLALAAAAPSTTPSTTSSGGVLISELMTNNKATIKDEDGAAPDWIELHNTGSSVVGLAGYRLVDSPTPGPGDTWTFPSGVSLAPGQYLLVFASGKNRTNPSSPLHTSFKLSPQDGYVALLTPSGSVASAVQFPDLPTDISFGTIGSAGAVTALASGSPQYAILASPTPGRDNSGPRPGGPLIVGTTRTAATAPGAAITVTSTVTQQTSPLASVQLYYTVGYGPEAPLPMTASADGATYSATIPGAPAGSLVRWYVKATDSQGQTTRDPPFASPTDQQYYGTIVADPSDTASLPVLELYCKDSKAVFGKTDVYGCSLMLNGTFYDNVGIRRRGVTSLNWPKPKIKVDSKQGSIFKIRPGMTVGELNLNSEWAEPGENTFMRETLMWQVFDQMGVQSLVSFQLHMRMNGQYFGKYAYTEEMDEASLKRWGYPVQPQAGPLWKSTSGEYSNLRWDVPPEHLQYYWKQYTRKGDNASEGQALLAFARGLAGGAPGVPRSKYLFDAVNLPQVINHMAAQTLVLNQDRCTKNFYIYLDPASGQWSMLPWDLESGFGIDRGLGGQPAPDYCILACEQWNSPLYCDHAHPQARDLAVKTPWGLITAQYDLYTTGRRLQQHKSGCRKLASAAAASSSDPLARAARKLMQDPAPAPASAVVPASGAAAAGLALPSNSSIPTDYDADLTKLGPTVTGAPGTYNYLIDAILSIPRTRQMYVRRLRTLMDTFVNTGRLQALVTAMYQQIRDEAKRDAKAWNNPGDPDRGYQQLITEQLPIRKQQLYETYGSQGPIPLIPDALPGSFQLTLGALQPGPAGFVEVQNPNGYAVDVSGYRLQGAVQFAFAPGTVIPAQDSVYAAASVAAFKQARGGQGFFAVGPYSGQLLGAAASVQLVKPDGTVLAST
ncbi:hypothetical protein ABPG75_009883 [Micractinium tetrahymenae]